MAKTQCSRCGREIWKGRTSAPAPVCHPCRGSSVVSHGSVYAYKRGCRCDACRAAKAGEMRRYAAKRRAEGVNIYHEYRLRPTRSDWIKPSARLAIYERDDWVCQICGDDVDASLHPLHRWAATLDHIKPQALELFPDHSPENLRLAHRACNSRRGVGGRRHVA